jgi:hypothetical protein
VCRVWLPPPKYRYKNACNQERYLDADLHPVPNRRGISVSDPTRPIQKTGIEIHDFSLDKAMPKFSAAIEEQIDCHDASDDFIKEKMHSIVRSSGADRWDAQTSPRALTAPRNKRVVSIWICPPRHADASRA